MRSLLSDELDDQLDKVQTDIAASQIPIAILFEGGSGRVISRVINELDRNLEPRGINYFHPDISGGEATVFAEIMKATPGKGEITLYDRSWYSLAVEYCNGDDRVMEAQIEAINSFERYLLDNGTFIIKIGFRMSNEDMNEYLGEYRTHTSIHNTFLSVNHIDRVKFRAVMPQILKGTDTKRAPWDIIDVKGVQETVEKTAETLIKRMKVCLKNAWTKSECRTIKCCFPNPRKDLELDQDASDYNDRMDELSEELERLQILLAASGRTLVLGFEGWDAAGKGGAIKHVCHALNPRGYKVARVKAPTQEDNEHTYLWRFARSMPDAGHITIFDRTWYGRVMVERLEGFCSENDWQRAYNEINEFEKELKDWGAVIIKFWVQIDKDTQLARFTDRQNTPEKQWKITDEDWRNREKWDLYEGAIDEMITKTSTSFAPWYVLESVDKKYARIKALKIMIEEIKKALSEK